MPDIIIYLQQETKQLKNQIILRGRSFEKNISIKYLESISKGYTKIFNQKHKFLLIQVRPEEVLELLTKKGQQNLFRKLFNSSS
jgi:deoxyadenosine/deoxycytidine kinase